MARENDGEMMMIPAFPLFHERSNLFRVSVRGRGRVWVRTGMGSVDCGDFREG